MAFVDIHRHISASRSLNYPELTANVANLANMIQNELQQGNAGTLWTVNYRVGNNNDIYLTILTAGFEFAHLSFHIGASRTPAGSTHLQYADKQSRRILINNGTFILENPPVHLEFEQIIMAKLNQFAQYYAQILRNKYLKYKNKYLQLKYELGI